MSLIPYIEQLRQRQNLHAGQAAAAASQLASAEVDEQLKADFLIALAEKGETPVEVAGFAEAFRSLARDPSLQRWAPAAVDIVGTGGDHAGGFNVSSMVVLLLSCLGLPVMKHGNRGITSKCGSADLFAALGYDLSATTEQLQRSMDQLGYAFLFAPSFHPAFKNIAPVRRSLAAQGRRTIFNILGPLINPARPGHVLMGVYSSSLVDLMAEAADHLDSRSGLVVYGEIGAGKGIDELTTATRNQVRGFGAHASVRATWTPSNFGLEESPFSDLVGGDLKDNLAIVEALLSGKGPKGLADTIVLNAAVCLWLADKVSCVEDGIVRAREALASGAIRDKIAATREFFSRS